MAWDRREGRAYYYRSVRENGRVRRQYVGTGPLAELAAFSDERDRRERQARRDAEQQARYELETALAPIEEACEVLDLAIRAVLLTLGFHQHKGTWRRRRWPT
jgi:hypothetical protein